MKQHIYEFFANLIIEGSFFFKDLATDSNATKAEE